MGKLVSKDSIPSKFSPKNPKECIICGKMFVGASSNAKSGNRKLDTKLTFVVHHKDGDPINNHPSNLVTLCHRCHKLVHNKTISLGKV